MVREETKNYETMLYDRRRFDEPSVARETANRLADQKGPVIIGDDITRARESKKKKKKETPTDLGAIIS